MSEMRWRNLLATFAAITIFGLAFGMTFPLLSLLLEKRGVPAPMIGLNAAMMPIGILLFTSLIPSLSTRFGARRLALAAATLTALLLLCYPWFDSLEAWFVLRLLQGMSVATLFVLSEAWIVGFATPSNRGRIVAAYASILSASFAAGPMIVAAVGIDGWTPFLIGTAIVLAGTVPLSLVVPPESEGPDETHTSGVLSFIPKAPMLLACVGAFAIMDAATLSLLPVYGLRYQFDVAGSAHILTAFIIGNVVLQFPIGMLADRYPRRLVLASCALVTTLMLAVLPLAMRSLWQWPVLVIGGACGYGVYTVSLSSLGDRFSGRELVEGTAAFGSVWGLGALTGSLLGGWAMASAGPDGLPLSLAFIYALLVVGLLLRESQQRD